MGVDIHNYTIGRLISPHIYGTAPGPPEIISWCELISVEEGQPIHLMCPVVTSEYATIYWRKDGSYNKLAETIIEYKLFFMIFLNN